MTPEAFTRARREQLRWLILFVLEKVTQSIGAQDASLRYMIAGAEGLEGLTILELRKELMYLYERELIHLDYGDHIMHWHAKLNRAGIDVAQYTSPCEPGIARPPRDWYAST
jgi:hypothetical protein